jgi:chemotaxis protein MotA
MAGLKRKRKPDFSTLLGLAVALLGIVGGLLLEGGKLQELLAPTAFLIVMGGTAGAVLVTTPVKVLRGAIRSLVDVFREQPANHGEVIDQIVEFATRARKNGIVALEQESELVSDPFLRKALMLAVDGTDLQELRKMMEIEMSVAEHRQEGYAKVFEGAGGYAPTIGIIGAVMGLIQVMKDLANIEKVGHGIATAFVATIYGVGFANILFLPAAGKIRARSQDAVQLRELMLEGVVGIIEGLNPKLIRMKLEAYAHDAAAGKPEPAPAPQTAPRGAKREAA